MQGPQGFVPGGFAVWCSFLFLNLTKAEHLDIMKTKGDTVTCSQASKSYYQIADHSSAIEWSACFCGEKEQQNCYQQENPQCFLPHLHHLPSHEMRWDFGGLTTKVTVSRMGHYIILRRTLSMLSKPPRRVSHTMAGWSFRGILFLYCMVCRSSDHLDHIVEPGTVVAGHEVGDGVFVQVLLDHLLQALPEGEGPAAGHAVAALVAGAETGHGD